MAFDPKLPAYGQLRRKWQQVVDEFVRCGVQCDAYTKVYGPTKRPDASAHKLFSKPEIRQAVTERTEQAIARAGVTNVRILEELAGIATVDPIDVFDDEGNMKPMKDIPAKVRRAIQGMDIDELWEGRGKDRDQVGITRKPRFYSKVEALKLLGQHLKLFTEKHEVELPGSADPSKLSELDKARRVGFLLWQGMRALQEAAASSDPESGNPAGSPPAHSNKQENHS